MNKPKPCDCDTCEERESVASVIRGEINRQLTKKQTPPVSYAIVILTQVLDGIKNSGPTGTPENT